MQSVGGWIRNGMSSSKSSSGGFGAAAGRARRWAGLRGAGLGLAWHWLLRRSRLHLQAAPRAPALPPRPPKHLHFVGTDFSGIALVAVLVGPLAGGQAAFDINLAAFFQVFDHFCLAAEEHHAVPFGAILFSPLFVFPAVGGGQGDVGDCVAARHVAHFGSRPRLPISMTLLREAI